MAKTARYQVAFEGLFRGTAYVIHFLSMKFYSFSQILGIACALLGQIFVLSAEMSAVQACSFPATPIYPSSFPHTPQDLEAFISSVGRDMSNSVACTKLPVSNQSDLSSALGQYWTALEKYITVQVTIQSQMPHVNSFTRYTPFWAGALMSAGPLASD